MKRLAWIISRVFDPVIEIPIMLGTAVWWALTNGLRWRFLVFLLVVDALLPALYMLWGLKKVTGNLVIQLPGSFVVHSSTELNQVKANLW